MEKEINYKGYTITGSKNGKIEAIITNNLFYSKQNEVMDKYNNLLGKLHLMYEPPIKFIFNSYESMTTFIDANPK